YCFRAALLCLYSLPPTRRSSDLFTGLSGRLAVRGVAERVFIKPDGQKSAYDLIRDAHAAGVRFKICTSAVELWGSDLIPEIEETVGSAYIVSEAMDDGTVTFTY